MSINIGDTVHLATDSTPMVVTELFPNMPADSTRPPLFARCSWQTAMTMRGATRVLENSTVLPITDLLKA